MTDIDVLRAELDSALEAYRAEFDKHDLSPEGEERFANTHTRYEAALKAVQAAELEQDTPIIGAHPLSTPAWDAFDKCRAALVQAQRDYNAARGWDLIGAMERLKAAQDAYEAACLLIKGGGGGWMTHFIMRHNPESARAAYRDGYRLMRVLHGTHKFFKVMGYFSNDPALHAGIDSFVSHNFRADSREQDCYHWLTGLDEFFFDALNESERKSSIDPIPF